ncbi:MAG TPA: NADH-ubiquinone oxidoreductase-F iron-sulfur binding region domain-containing protein [Streptosporangiaceae bacterium]
MIADTTTTARLLKVAAGADYTAHTSLIGPLPLRGSVRPGRVGPLGPIVAAAGLRGRGGGWFPFARKMEAVAAATGIRPPVVVVNGMESEPLSTKDGHLLATAPHLVMDGAALAAEAIGADRVIIAVPAAAGDRPRLGPWLDDLAAERAARGVDPVDIVVAEGPKRYLSGQETALVNWVNGGPALPTTTRPFKKGVEGRATLVSNAETFAHLGLIGRYGPKWFRAAGTRDAPGTALLTISGAVVHPGVLEVPLGIPVQEVLRAADAIPDPAAVLFGGYGGTWLAGTDAAALTIDPESMKAAGAALGPGIIHVLPRDVPGLLRTAEIARWMETQGAGQCGPCRFGLRALSADLDRALRGDIAAADRLRRRLALLPGRGGCAHPDGTARLVTSALAVFGAALPGWQDSRRQDPGSRLSGGRGSGAGSAALRSGRRGSRVRR